MIEIVNRIVKDVNAALAQVAKTDPLTAELVRLDIGSETTWTDETAGRIPQLALRHTDGRAG